LDLEDQSGELYMVSNCPTIDKDNVKKTQKSLTNKVS